mgnify:FL=1
MYFSFLVGLYSLDSECKDLVKMSQSFGFAADLFSNAKMTMPEDKSFLIINLRATEFYLIDVAAAKMEAEGRVSLHQLSEQSMCNSYIS